MPKHARNTKRGSRVSHAAQLVQRSVEAAIAQHNARPAIPLKSLAAHHGLSYEVLKRRMRKYHAAERAGDAAGMADASRSHRGGHNRTFTREQEGLLKDTVLAAAPAMGHQQIKEAALQLARDVRVAGHARELRHHRAFTASDGSVSALKQRNQLSSHRCATLPISERELSRRDVETECFHFCLLVRGAIEEYGAARVLNMDETPTSVVDMPVTAVVRTGSKQPARIKTEFLNKYNVTTFPCIAANGTKLPLCAVIKGKTERCLKKIKDGASLATRRVRLYTSVKGWMTTAIMQKWLEEVVAEYTHEEPSALLLDRYPCHWAPEVVALAASLNIRLIQVPGGCTSTLQPLDVSFNGPMLKARQRIWRETRLRRPWQADTYQAAVERTQLAYQSMSRRLTRSAWTKAGIVD